MFPDFIGIGAQKAGTTWLHRNLQAHPQIWIPRKEVHYFDRKIADRSNALTRLFGRGQINSQWRRQVKAWILRYLIEEPSLEGLLWTYKYYMRHYNDEWYASIFEPRKGRMTGEITPAYSVLGRDMVAHIHGLMPDTKIIFMMRNPIERAWSQAVMSFDKAEGSTEHIGEKKYLRKLQRESFQLLTSYLQTLENWETFYPEERIFVGFLEDVHFFPEELLRSIYSFLGVDPYFDPALTGKKIHSRSVGAMPTAVALRLAHDYQEEITRLSERFGGYTSFWLYCADRLITESPKVDSIPYPLWGSFLWDEWASVPSTSSGADSRGVQSGPLSSVRVAK